MKNDFQIRGDVVAIILKRKDGTTLEGIIDVEDLAAAQSIAGSWFASWSNSSQTFYVHANRPCIERHLPKLTIHRHILGLIGSDPVDHWDHDGLNNRRTNLKAGDVTTNALNRRGPSSLSTTGRRGVGVHPSGLYRGRVTVYHSTVHLGYFKNPLTARMACEKFLRDFREARQEN